MKALGAIADPKDIANAKYVNERYHVWKADETYAADAWVVHNGYLWHNTSGTASTGVEPGTDYNVWNVNYSNRNLLDNPFFTVNSRGQSSYVTTDYTIDRWRGHSGNPPSIPIVEIIDKGIRISCSDTYDYQWLHEFFGEEMTTKFAGKKLTLSLSYEKTENTILLGISAKNKKNTSTTYGNKYYDDVSELPQKGIIHKTFTMPQILEDNAGLQIAISVSNGAAINNEYIVRAIKLELGSVSTLANDTIPDYGSEFVKCVTSTADPKDTYANKTLLTT